MWNVEGPPKVGRVRYPLFATEKREPKRRRPAVHWQGDEAHGKWPVRRSRYAKMRREDESGKVEEYDTGSSVRGGEAGK